MCSRPFPTLARRWRRQRSCWRHGPMPRPFAAYSTRHSKRTATAPLYRILAGHAKVRLLCKYHFKHELSEHRLLLSPGSDDDNGDDNGDDVINSDDPASTAPTKTPSRRLSGYNR